MLDKYPEILTPEETMKILRIGRNKIYDLIKNKEIKSFGRPARIAKEHLIEYINKQNY